MTESETGDSLQRLVGIKLTVAWLRQAVSFAHHQMKTRPEEAHTNKRYWTKQVLKACLQTCSVTNRYIVDIYESAKERGDESPPFPATWFESALRDCHFVPTNMFFGKQQEQYSHEKPVVSKLQT